MSNPNVIANSNYGPMIINVYDRFIGRSILQTGYWANNDIELIKQLVSFLLTKKDSLIFYDVGANIGTHALAISKSFGVKVKVRAFEAQRNIFNMLCGTVAINGLQNIYCHNLAVSDERGKKIKIPLPDYNKNNNFGGLELIPAVHTDNQDLIKVGWDEVETITLDDFNEDVDFIKMDIEGMEDKAISGSSLIFERSRPIAFIEVAKTDGNFIISFFRRREYCGFMSSGDLLVIPKEYALQVNGLDQLF
jgi:FkbM family methyltransferase